MINPTNVVPMVIDNSGRGERAYDIYSLLLKERIIFLGLPINDQVANLIIAQLLYLNGEDATQPINMYITSPGGSIYSGLAIYDTMQMIQAPVATYAVGVTASMGTVILTAGAKGQTVCLAPCHYPYASGQQRRSGVYGGYAYCIPGAGTCADPTLPPGGQTFWP